jgi:hypothetical protein
VAGRRRRRLFTVYDAAVRSSTPGAVTRSARHPPIRLPDCHTRLVGWCGASLPGRQRLRAGR